MKFILTLGIVTCSLISFAQTKVDSTDWFHQPYGQKLIGKWKLMRIKTDAAPYIPPRKFYLHIFRQNILFDRDTGSCHCDSFLINEKQIRLYSIACDKEYPKASHMGNWINYTGKYWFENDLLYIHEQGTYMVYVLKKVP